MSAEAVPTMITRENTSPESVPQNAQGETLQGAAQRLRSTRYDQMAKAASAGLMSHPHVESAIVEISGGHLQLHFTATHL